jgi:C-terminal processing protease CtpA/Prc
MKATNKIGVLLNRSRLIAFGLCIGLLSARGLVAAECPPLESNRPFEEARLRLVAYLLRQVHYDALSLQNELSARFFDRFIDLIDPDRVDLWQSDVDEFSRYRLNMADFAQAGDISPALEIYERFRVHVEEHLRYFQDVLATNRFDGLTSDGLRDVRQSPRRPAHLMEARHLWAQKIDNQYVALESIESTSQCRLQLLRKVYEDRSKSASWHHVLELYLAALAKAYDPHSDFLNRAEAEDFASAITLNFVGMGIRVSLESDKNAWYRVDEVVPGGPADRSGEVHVGDHILSLVELGKDGAIQALLPALEDSDGLRSRKGMEVQITLIPRESMSESDRKRLVLICDEIRRDEDAAAARIVEVSTTEGRSVRITMAQFFRPSGGGVQLHGITADIVLSATSSTQGLCEKSLPGALPWNNVPPAQHARLNRVSPYLASLREQLELRNSSHVKKCLCRVVVRGAEAVEIAEPPSSSAGNATAGFDRALGSPVRTLKTNSASSDIVIDQTEEILLDYIKALASTGRLSASKSQLPAAIGAFCEASR